MVLYKYQPHKSHCGIRDSVKKRNHLHENKTTHWYVGSVNEHFLINNNKPHNPSKKDT